MSRFDEPAILKPLTRLLGAAGYRVAAFGSPRDFLEQYDSEACGCLVLDVSMPGLNGIQLQQALIERSCYLPVIFLTGCGDIPTSVQAMKHGAVDFLTKPVNDTALIAAVQQAFERDAAGQASRAEIAVLRQRLAILTPREYQVLGHVIAGRLNNDGKNRQGASRARDGKNAGRLTCRAGAAGGPCRHRTNGLAASAGAKTRSRRPAVRRCMLD